MQGRAPRGVRFDGDGYELALFGALAPSPWPVRATEPFVLGFELVAHFFDDDRVDHRRLVADVRLAVLLCCRRLFHSAAASSAAAPRYTCVVA